jgi:hypothetical protein
MNSQEMGKGCGDFAVPISIVAEVLDKNSGGKE